MTSPLSRAAALARLGLAPDATRDQVVSAFRASAWATHPDVADSPDSSAEEFSALRDAYRLLAEEAPADPPPPRSPRPGPPLASPFPPAHRPTRRPPLVAGPVYVAPLPQTRAEARGGGHA